MLAQVGARLLGPLLVADPHLLRRARMILVQLVEHGLPVVGAAQLARAPGELRRQLVVRGLPAIPELSSSEAEQLLLPQQGRVALLAERVVAGGHGAHLLQERDVRVIGRSRRFARLGQLRPQRAVLHLGRQDLPDVAGAGARLVGGTIEKDAGNHLGSQVALPVLEVAGDQAHARHGGVDQLLDRPEPMQEEAEDAGHAGVQVDVGLPAPDLEVLQDLPPAQRADDEVPIDAIVEPEGTLVHAPESLEPGAVGAASPLEGGLGEVVEQLVVLGQAQAAGANG